MFRITMIALCWIQIAVGGAVALSALTFSAATAKAVIYGCIAGSVVTLVLAHFKWVAMRRVVRGFTRVKFPPREG